MSNPSQQVLLDFEISAEQLEALQLFARFKSSGVYDALGGTFYQPKLPAFDHVQTWYQVQYNDSTYDVPPVYLDLILKGEVVKKIRCQAYPEVELPAYEGPEYEMLSFTIPRSFLS